MTIKNPRRSGGVVIRTLLTVTIKQSLRQRQQGQIPFIHIPYAFLTPFLRQIPQRRLRLGRVSFH